MEVPLPYDADKYRDMEYAVIHSNQSRTNNETVHG